MDLYDDGDAWSSFDPDSIAPGQAWDCEWDVRNGGDDAASGFWVDFYASKNSTISQADHLLGGVWVSGIAGDDYATVDLSLSSFPNLATGNYYVGIIIDPTNLVAETSEINNYGVDSDDYPLYVASFAADDAYEQNDFAADAWAHTGDWQETLLSTINGLGLQRDDDW
ncbi:MAG: hypothetical protein GY700_15225, partial [Propionibacteriaceae bacterium]|nr:hypothetical protein [Propionibacteriaceae bacterium]